ncbi:hypothetical protein FD13_GL001452 [Levilactobacillus senmaizukei DSM 21775 = NBRC 103853]|uniref:Holin n=2 Tax=Levilactobacillus senmaizukei TaxID=431273 RepID=A0A0R2DDR7_9LACO|nr:hypothetical protein FD13_GL001452 [Levilactobacillus senmaizukei DSM 21775 = NBRC 103853]
MADLLTGIVKSFTKGAKIKADSSVGLKGLSKHLLIIVLALTVYPFLDVLEFDTVSNAVLLFYTAEYAISIVENLDVMGFPIPPFLKPKFEKLAKIAGKEDDDK